MYSLLYTQHVHTYTVSMKETAVFGGGCFWCTEAVFSMLEGVSSVVPGYAGGETENPTYTEVSSGTTGHVEVIKITFDPTVIPYTTLLTVFFATHDGSQVNRQGNDVGTQYRSVVFYTNESQKKAAEEYIEKLNASTKEGDPIVTSVEALPTFYEAEEYHKEYFARNPGAAYCQLVINPKLDKVQKEFTTLVKKI